MIKMTCRCHYFEEIDANENHIKIKCNKCGLTDTISQKWQYLSNGKIQTREGEGE